MEKTTLIKVGGAELASGKAIESLVAALAPIARETHTVVVHGGGKDIAALQKRLGLEPQFVQGLRVTDWDSLQVAEMTLSGTVNKRLVAHLVGARVRALGLSGVDAGLLRATKLEHAAGDLGRVGKITHVNTDCLWDLMRKGFTAGVSPISLGADGLPFNVNADHAALALAKALQVDEIVFLTDVPGVMLGGAVVPTLTATEVDAAIASGEISGGMIPKVRSALTAVDSGAARARITNLDGLAHNSGTWIAATS